MKRRQRLPSGCLGWQRNLFFEGLEGRRMLAAGDAFAANSADHLLLHGESNVAEGEGGTAARFRFETVDAAGLPTAQFEVGETVELRVYVEDVRSAPLGVFSSYLDLTYDTGMLSSASSLSFGSTYPNVPSGDISQDGMLDEVGAFSSAIVPLGPGEFFLFSVQFTAATSGSVNFAGDAADVSPDHDLLVYGSGVPLMPNEVDFGMTTIQIVDDLQIIDDGQFGYSEVGTGWGMGGLAGAFQGDYRYHQPGTGTSQANWVFNNLGTGDYELFGSWMPFSNRASDAQFTIRDGATLEATVEKNQQAAPDDLVAGGQFWESLGTYQVTNGSLSIQLSDAANGVVIADAIRIASTNAGPPPPPSGGDQIVDNNDPAYSETGLNWATGGLTGAYQGDYRYHSPGSGANATWAFTSVANGDYDLYASWTAHENRASNARFDIADGGTIEATVIRNQQVAPDDLVHNSQSWEHLGVITVDQGAVTVSLSDVADGIVIADAVYLTPSDGPPPPPTGEAVIVDDGDANFVQTGFDWRTGGLAGAYQGDYQYHTPGPSGATSEWQFDVDNGNYAVFATWTAHSNRASNAPFTVFDGSALEGTSLINQQQAADDLFADGQFWKELGEFEIENGMLNVRLSDNANGIVIADAIRIESVDPPPPPTPGPPSVSSLSASPNPSVLEDTITVSAGGVTDDDLVNQVVFYQDANANGTLEPLADTEVGLDADGSNGYQVTLTAASLGVGSHTLFAQAEDNSGLFSTPVSTTAEVLAFELVLDDGDAGFSESGAPWQPGGLAGGHSGDYRSRPAASGANRAIWQTAVSNGAYDVYTTWTAHANRASNAAYAVLDGGSMVQNVTIDQRTAANDVVAGGTNWELLGTVTITSGQLSVELSDLADGYVIADAIRLVQAT